MIHDIPEFSPVDPNHNGVPEEEDASAIPEDHNGIVLGVAVSDEVDGKHYMASVGNDYALFVYTLDRRACSAWHQQNAHKG